MMPWPGGVQDYLEVPSMFLELFVYRGVLWQTQQALQDW